MDSILASLDEVDPEFDRLWVREAEDRLAAFRRCEIRALPLQQVLGKDRAQ